MNIRQARIPLALARLARYTDCGGIMGKVAVKYEVRLDVDAVTHKWLVTQAKLEGSSVAVLVRRAIFLLKQES